MSVGKKRPTMQLTPDSLIPEVISLSANLKVVARGCQAVNNITSHSVRLLQQIAYPGLHLVLPFSIHLCSTQEPKPLKIIH